LIVTIAGLYGAHPVVEAVALGGSRSTGWGDDTADFDLYVYSRDPLPLDFRAAIAKARGARVDLDNRFWEPGDEWVEHDGSHYDVMFRSTVWIEDQLARCLDRHEPSIGYSTCIWANVLHSRILFDRNGWYARLQAKSRSPYPDPLRRAIVAKNHPILRSTLSSYRHQIAKALERDDPIAVNHRIAALLASYTDILFAVNRVPHPGEKRLDKWVELSCPKRPPEFRDRIAGLIGAPRTGILFRLNSLLDHLDALLKAEKLI
jgi:hypothetical protein